MSKIMLISSLSNSPICRLCAEESENGSFLYSNNENEENLSELINTYLPIKVTNDGKLPQTICPGCNIQLEATMEFINLIIKGQKILREVIKNHDIKPAKYAEGNSAPVLSEINEDQVYSKNHPIALKALGIETPKRKRGRPKKVKMEPEEASEVVAENTIELETQTKEESVEVSGKRKRKTPSRFREAVQGKELDQIFKQEGMMDLEESEEEVSKPTVKVPPGPAEVIGHSEVSGELVVVVKGKGRGRPKGSVRNKKQSCVICGMEFSCVGRYMCHVAQHGAVRFRCVTCGQMYDTRLMYEQHQLASQHEGLEVLQPDENAEVNVELTTIEEPTEEQSNYSPTPDINLENAKDNTQNVEPIEVINISIKEELGTIVKADINMKDFGISKLDENVNCEEVINCTVIEEDEGAENSDIQENENCDVIIEPENNPLEVDENEDAGPDTISSTETQKSDSQGKKADREKLKERPNDGNNKLKCPFCDKILATKQSKSMHIKARHNGERPYVCRVCGAAFPYPRSLTLHLVTHRKNDPAIGYACDLCGKVLNHPSSVVYHKESEHGGQSYACGKCGKSFKHKQLLQRHQLVHTQQRPFHCKVCEATFKTKTNLAHHQSLHSGVKRFSCDICKQKFAHKTSLTLHMRWHSGDKPYQCSVCGKGFTQKGNLAEHIRIHTGERPYRCEICPRNFTTSSQFRLHEKRHVQLGIKPYSCQNCGKTFAYQNSMKTHIKRAKVDPTECDRNKMAARTPRPHGCTHCSRTFPDPSSRNKHMRLCEKRQLSLLNSSVISPLSAMSPAHTDELEERVIVVTYDINEDNILDAQNEESLGPLVEEGGGEVGEVGEGGEEALRSVYSGAAMLSSPRAPSPALYLDDDHVTVTDQEGNPITLTMQDGTRLAITSLGGKSLQMITEDGHSIPIEYNGFTNEEEVQSTEDIPELSLQKSLEDDISTETRYYSIV